MLKNNWVLQRERLDDIPDAIKSISGDGSGYYEPRPGVGLIRNRVSIGDEIEAEHTAQWGIVIGIIRNKGGEPVCYKVWCGEEDNFELDYIAYSDVTLCEQCESAEWSLGRIGYEWVECSSRYGVDGYFYNRHYEDVIFW